jgi:hypothetical protein
MSAKRQGQINTIFGFTFADRLRRLKLLGHSENSAIFARWSDLGAVSTVLCISIPKRTCHVMFHG